MRVVVTANVASADALTPLLLELAVPVAERWDPVPYDKFPGTLMATTVLEPRPDGDARDEVRALAVRLGIDAPPEGDESNADLVWNDAEVRFPGVFWVLVEASPDQGGEPAETVGFEPLDADPPLSDEEAAELMSFLRDPNDAS